MKRKICILALMLFATLNLFCSEISVSIKPGSQWKKRAPQLSVWLEDENENYIATLYVTKSASKKAWKFSPKEGRPDSLPVWYTASQTNPSSADKTASKDLDAVTSATPKKLIATKTKLKLQQGKSYIIKAEVNQSFDYNKIYTKKNSGVNGQPSVIYIAGFCYTNKKTEITLQFLGTGSLDGSDGKIHLDQNTYLTTAQNIVESICITTK